MPCYSPLQAFRTSFGEIVFSKPKGFSLPQVLSCGQCIGCRLKRSSSWACRCVNEASLYKRNSFITLTYSNDNLPNPPTLVVRDFQLFMKRFRKRLVLDYYNSYLKRYLGRFGFTYKSLIKHALKRFPKIRYLMCGEYGDRFGRPHYHAIIFNYDFPDRYLWEVKNGFNLYRSSMLEDLWPLGHCIVADFTFETAAYVARYSLKKITGKAAEQHYSFCPKTGEVFSRLPEYIAMSRRPGIGKYWIDKFMSDVYPHDQLKLIDKPPMQPPKFYDSQFELVSPGEFAMIKLKRKADAKERAVDAPNLNSQRICAEAKLSKLVRVVD